MASAFSRLNPLTAKQPSAPHLVEHPCIELEGSRHPVVEQALQKDGGPFVANDPRAVRWFPGLRIVKDAAEGLGPLHGLRTALAAAEGAPVLVAEDPLTCVVRGAGRVLDDPVFLARVAFAP